MNEAERKLLAERDAQWEKAIEQAWIEGDGCPGFRRNLPDTLRAIRARLSVEQPAPAEQTRSRCGQTLPDYPGTGGEYICPKCGVPRLHDATPAPVPAQADAVSAHYECPAAQAEDAEAMAS